MKYIIHILFLFFPIFCLAQTKIYKGNSNYQSDCLYTWDGTYLYKGNSKYTSDILITYKNNCMYKGRSQYNYIIKFVNNKFYTIDDKYTPVANVNGIRIYSGSTNYFSDLLCTYTNNKIYFGQPYNANVLYSVKDGTLPWPIVLYLLSKSYCSSYYF